MGVDFADLAMMAAERLSSEEWTSQTGKVVTRSAGFVDVQPVNKRWVDTAEGGHTYEALPIIPNLPIAFPGPITWPVNPGQCGLIVHLSQSEAEFRRNETVNQEPGDLRRKHLAHAVFLPFFTGPDTGASDAVNEPAFVVTSSEIRLGSKNAVNFAAMANLVDFEFTDLALIIAQIATVLNTAGPVTGAPGTITLFTPESVASSKIKLDD